MSPTGPRTIALTSIVLCAFAANSLLCRGALAGDRIDATSFTVVRLLAGAATLFALVRVGGVPGSRQRTGRWSSAAALFVYALAFSLAYVRLGAGVGALLLMGAVQTTMLGWGVVRGERLAPRQWMGVAAAIGGLSLLTLRGASVPEPEAASLMLLAGAAWGAYTLLGRGVANPLAATADNFVRTIPAAVVALFIAWKLGAIHVSTRGLLLAGISGSLTSGMAYALWYSALRGLRASQAAVVQLVVPVLAAVGGVVLLDEHLTLHMVVSGTAVLAGVALAIRARATAPVRGTG